MLCHMASLNMYILVQSSHHLKAKTECKKKLIRPCHFDTLKSVYTCSCNYALRLNLERMGVTVSLNLI